MTVVKMTPDLVEEARALQADGWSLGQIAKHFGVKSDTIRYRLDEHYRDDQREKQNRRRRAERALVKTMLRHIIDPYGPTKEEIRALQRLIPVDTRSLTGKLLGDPVFERSALFHKTQQQGMAASA